MSLNLLGVSSSKSADLPGGSLLDVADEPLLQHTGDSQVVLLEHHHVAVTMNPLVDQH